MSHIMQIYAVCKFRCFHVLPFMCKRILFGIAFMLVSFFPKISLHFDAFS